MKKCLILYLALLALPAISGTTETMHLQSHRTVISNRSYVESPAGKLPKVIYGNDDRLDIYQVSDPVRLQQAASTCGLFATGDVSNNGNGTFTISLYSYFELGKFACADEPYASQPVSAFCTGFLVGPDLIATAGHCYENADLSATRFVFSFKMNNATTPLSVVNTNQVYRGTSIVGRALIDDLDYAVIRLDRAVTSPEAVVQPLRRKGTLAIGTKVGVIGHPSGLPMKVAFGDQTLVRENHESDLFYANTDTYGGNSGSPVFNAVTNQVEGILVSGEIDFVSDGSCFRSNRMADSEGGEGVSRTNQLTRFVPGITTDADTYGAGATIEITVVEDNLPASSFAVTAAATGGDVETVLVSDPDNNNVYTGSIAMGLPGASAIPLNNAIETIEAGTITVSYSDVNAGGSIPMVFTDTATAVFGLAESENWHLYE